MCVPPGLRIRGTLASGLSEDGTAAQWLQRSASQQHRVALQMPWSRGRWSWRDNDASAGTLGAASGSWLCISHVGTSLLAQHKVLDITTTATTSCYGRQMR